MVLAALYYTHDVISFQNFQLALSFKACSHIKSLFGQQKMVTQFLSLNFHHSSLITHHSNFHIHLPSSFNFYHSIFFTLFMDPTTVTMSDYFCFVTRVPFSSPSYFSFSHFPFPFSPVSLPKQKLKPRKMSQPPSPRQYHHHW